MLLSSAVVTVALAIEIPQLPRLRYFAGADSFAERVRFWQAHEKMSRAAVRQVRACTKVSGRSIARPRIRDGVSKPQEDAAPRAGVPRP